MEIGRLHVLTDFVFQQRHSHADIARLAIRGGAEIIQFREKRAGIRHVVREAAKAADECHARSIPLIIDDRLDVALAVGAAGVHLGQKDLPVALARKILGDDAIIGATADTIGQARIAESDGASYIGFGPVFRTASKESPESVRGVDALADVCAALRIPVIAIAGITAEKVRSVIEAGAHGVAVMTAVTLAEDPESATRELAEAVREASLSHAL